MHHKILLQFLQLADLRHFGRAADACHVSPSTLSRTISQLEDQLGVRLFERDNRQVRVTAAGERLRVYAREALAQWEKFSDSVLDAAEELSGELSIYCSVTASYSFLHHLLAQFCEHHPRVQIKLHTGDPDQAIARVLGAHEALAIGTRPDRIPAGLAFREVASSQLVFIRSASRQTIATSAAALGHEPMILPERGVTRERVEQWFRDRNIKPEIAAQVAGNEAIVSMVSLGAGVGVVPSIVLQNSPLANQVVTLAVRPQLKGIRIGLFALKKRLDNRLVQALWETPTNDSSAPGSGTNHS